MVRINEVDSLPSGVTVYDNTMVSVTDTDDGVVERYRVKQLMDYMQTGMEFMGLNIALFNYKIKESVFGSAINGKVYINNHDSIWVNRRKTFFFLRDRDYSVLMYGKEKTAYALFSKGLWCTEIRFVWIQKVKGYGYRLVLRIDRSERNFDTLLTEDYVLVYFFITEDWEIYLERLWCNEKADVICSGVLTRGVPSNIKARLSLTKGTVL